MVSTTYPPLTPLPVMALHPEVPGTPPRAWACRRKTGTTPVLVVEHVTFDWRCPGCVAAAARWVGEGQDMQQRWRITAEALEQIVMLSWLVRRAQWCQSEAGPQ